MSYFKLGEWNVICDRCGFEFKSSGLRKEWTGLRVCNSCWESRHPQDLLHPPRTEGSIPWARPEPTDVFVAVGEAILTEYDEFLFTETGETTLTET